MRIDSYEFGRIRIGGTDYDKDVLVFSDRVIYPWIRKEGHGLCIEDLSKVLSSDVEVLVIGTGLSGLMKVPREVLDEIEIEVHIRKTAAAVDLYNSMKGKKTAAALHITC